MCSDFLMQQEDLEVTGMAEKRMVYRILVGKPESIMKS
jgi:hypothetical protein